MRHIPQTALVVVAVVVALSRAESSATKPSAAKFLVITDVQRGFAEGDERYVVGMKVQEFKARFGEPERGDDGALNYNRDGLRIIHEDGKVKRFVFFAQRDDLTEFGSGVFDAASAKTDKGVDATSTVREVVKAHGKPAKKVETSGGIYLTYAFGTFEFKGSRLNVISIGDPD